jgi:DNA-binding response OmpR family regulator
MPKLVIGLIRGELARTLEAHFKQLGWRVCSADTSDEVRSHAHGGRAAAVVLPASAFDAESGYLTCAKLVRCLPKARVVIVGQPTEENERLALFAGAAGYLADTAGLAEIAAVITGKPAKVS